MYNIFYNSKTAKVDYNFTNVFFNIELPCYIHLMTQSTCYE